VQTATLNWDAIPGAPGYRIIKDGKVVAISAVPSCQFNVEGIPAASLGSDWRNSWGDPGNTASAKDVINPQLRLKWQSNVGFTPDINRVRKRLLAADGKIFATKHDWAGIPAGVAIDAETGVILWKSGKRSEGAITTNAGIQTIQGNTLWASQGHEYGYTVDIGTGEQKSVLWGQSAATSAYTVSDERGIYGYGIGGINSSNNPQVQTLNPDGKIRWTKPFKGMFRSFSYYAGGELPHHALLGQPATDGSTLIVPMGKLVAFGVATGAELWSRGNWTAGITTGQIAYFGKAHIQDGFVYCLGQKYLEPHLYEAPKLYAYDMAGGSLWSNPVPMPIPNYNYQYGFEALRGLSTDPISFTVRDGIIYARNSNLIMAIRTSGEILWTKVYTGTYQSQASHLTGPLILSGDTLFVIHNKDIKALSTLDGSELWSFTNPQPYIFSWLIAYQGLQAIDDAGNVYSFGN
jgi:outer membrane protein assembly factor BamB